MKKLNFMISIILIAVLLISSLPQQQVQAASNVKIDSAYTDKARYNPGDTAQIVSTVTNSGSSSWSGDVIVNIYHLESLVQSITQQESLIAGETKQVTFSWVTPSTDFKGYFVEVQADTSTEATSIDVSSDFTKYPRYGYLSEFSSIETGVESTDKVNELARDYKINAWQFYDWMWRHEKFIKRTNGTIDSPWYDLFDREVSWDTLQNQISAVHGQNGKAMAYAMVYAAREDYANYGVDPQWGIYKDMNHSSQFDVDFGDGQTYLYLFDPKNQNWQNYIYNEYMDAVNTGGFDGIHIDQMGQRQNVYDYEGNKIELSEHFTPFVNQTKIALTNNNSNKDHVTFNIVDGTTNGWAANDVSTHADVDFLYSEIWWQSNSYKELKNYIDEIRTNSGNKTPVLAAYMNYNENTGPRYEAEDAALTNVGVNTNHGGYTGTGFVDQYAEEGDSVEFTINAPEDGMYSTVFRYANSTGATSTRNLYVDGQFIAEVPFQNQANWDTWAHDAWYQIQLTSGNHTIKLAYDSGNTGAINLDNLTLGTFDEDSVRLADAMMAASGATHI